MRRNHRAPQPALTLGLGEPLMVGVPDAQAAAAVMLSASSICAHRKAAMSSPGDRDEPMSPRCIYPPGHGKNWERFVPSSRMIPRALGAPRSIDQQGAAPPEMMFLVSWKESAPCARSRRAVGPVARHHRLRGILDDEQVVAAGDVHDRVHLANDARVMHRHDRARTRGDRRLDQTLVDVERVRRTSTNTGTAPRNTKAFAVDTKV